MIRTYIQQLKENQQKGLSSADMIWCTIRYGASPNNYCSFGFRELSGPERATYVTNRLSRKMIKRFNNQEYINLFEDKVLFAELFSDYFARKWISTENMTYDRFQAFIEGEEKFIYKPISNAQGQGIRVFDHFSNVKEIYEEISKQNEKAILEQWITQHPTLNNVYSQAINCLRIITVCQDGHVDFLAGGMTWGNGKKIANASASGIVSPVNFETGILEKPAADFSGNVYHNHPITGAAMVGLQLPYWQETLQMVRDAAQRVPQVGYVGWDIAITPCKPIIIEGNTTPGYKYYQIPAHMDNRKGNRAVYEACYKMKAKLV